MTPWAVINPARLAGSGLLRTQSDARLVDLVRAGNDRAFEAIVLRYHRQLLRHCRRLLPAGRAEDAVQQAFLRALEAMRADQRDLQLGPWLHRIAHNTAIDSLRRLDSHWEELDDRMDGVEPTDAAVERRARFDSVVSTMGDLPERQRRALVLRELEGRSYDEIAATLGVTGAGVRQLLNRARNTVRAAASALVPPALVGRIAGSHATVRIAEIVDPPASALMAKATAAVAAGAVALLAVNGPPTGDGGNVSRAEAGTRPPAVQEQPDSGKRSSPAAAPADAGSEARRTGADRGESRRDAAGDRKEGRRRDARRTAAGPGPTAGGGGGDSSRPGPRAAPLAGVETEDDDDAPASRTRVVADDDDDDGPASAGAPAVSDDGDDDGGGQPSAPAAPAAPPADDDGGDGADDTAPTTSSVPATPAPAAAPAPAASDDGDSDIND